MSVFGLSVEKPTLGAQEVSDELRENMLEKAWASGNLSVFLNVFTDTALEAKSCQLVADFVLRQIRATVSDSVTADALCPNDHLLGTKRMCMDSNYYATYNRSNVHLVDLKQDPIIKITPSGIDTASRSHELDVIVFATGFDAITGPLVAVDIRGRGGVQLAKEWADGPKTYLGLAVEKFPNFFMITGPQSPSVLSNMVVSIEQHVEWIGGTIKRLRDNGWMYVEPTKEAVAEWQEHTSTIAGMLLISKAKSWYTGANVEGKSRTLLPYAGGVGTYRKFCDEETVKGLPGFFCSEV